ncbi:Transaldolase [Gracilaria domingensis]|nr:Transaldolase [Gracilaria domingensis]
MTATQLTQYDSLRAITTIVEDTGEIETIRAHRPYAATTNPSLVAAAAAKPEYKHLLEEAVKYGQSKSIAGTDTLAIVRNKLFTLFGAEILKYIPGDVSTEVDARLSFDVPAQVEVAQQIIKMYDEVGVGRERVLIKLATTWEGVQACRQLESMGIKTNMTLLFSLAQAVAAAEAGAYLISPFVGRILDWYKKAEGVDSYPAHEDPGVKSVKQIYNYYKCMGHDTIVMGASFRNKGEILELAGCDRLTIAPKFINSLKDTPESVETKLSKPSIEECNVIPKLSMDEPQFRWFMNEDPMATEKLAHGIRGFARDLEKLDKQLQGMMNA